MPPVLPLTPTIKPKPKATDQTLQFFWSGASDSITGHLLECPEISYSQVIDPAACTYIVTGLTNGTEYTFTLKAQNATGDSDPAIFRTVEPGMKASAALSLTVTAGPGGSVTLSWSPPSDDGGADIKWYVIRSSSSNGADPVIHESVEPWRTSHTLYGLNGASTYTFSVYAVNNPGYSPAATAVLTPSAIIQAGLLVWFDAATYSGSGTWYDGTSNHFDATVENGTPSLNGAGNGVVFNGSTNFIFSNIGNQSQWTMSVWIKNIGGGGSSACVITENYAGGNINMTLLTNGEGISAYQFAGGFWAPGWKLGTPITLPLNEWHSIVVTWDGTNIRSYYDAALQGTVAFGDTSQTDGQQYRIGRRWDDQDYIQSELGEILIYNRALTGSEVSQNYSASAGNY